MNQHAARPIPPARRRALALALVAPVLLAGSLGRAACGGDEAADPSTSANSATSATSAGADVAAASPRLVSPAEAQAFLAAPPAGLTVLDVRTAEEFAAGRLEGAIMIDFQSASFAADVDQLPHDAPVFVYCRSGNRSAQAVAQMVQLGFTDITELDGGIVAWQAAGQPVVTG